MLDIVVLISGIHFTGNKLVMVIMIYIINDEAYSFFRFGVVSDNTKSAKWL